MTWHPNPYHRRNVNNIAYTRNDAKTGYQHRRWEMLQRHNLQQAAWYQKEAARKQEWQERTRLPQSYSSHHQSSQPSRGGDLSGLLILAVATSPIWVAIWGIDTGLQRLGCPPQEAFYAATIIWVLILLGLWLFWRYHRSARRQPALLRSGAAILTGMEITTASPPEPQYEDNWKCADNSGISKRNAPAFVDRGKGSNTVAGRLL
jgi:hypothetical protein